MFGVHLLFKPSRSSHCVLSFPFPFSSLPPQIFNTIRFKLPSQAKQKRVPIPVDFSFSFSSLPDPNSKHPKLFNHMPTTPSVCTRRIMSRTLMSTGGILSCQHCLLWFRPQLDRKATKARGIPSSKLSNGRNPNRSGRSDCPS